MSKENMSEEMKNKEKIDNNERKSVHDEKRTELDKFKKQQLVDDIPLEDLKIEERNNDDKTNSQSTSQSERKYKE
ncbi:hypothetical protein [Gracilibacillus xinjiangensis]|uniref:3-methyladenine DNA glycosylase n=1 Tax=Gracilibacillus xinjiangensis TaxID=1193282 RepID=A0ABV8WVM7_9BACI